MKKKEFKLLVENWRRFIAEGSSSGVKIARDDQTLTPLLTSDLLDVSEVRCQSFDH